MERERDRGGLQHVHLCEGWLTVSADDGIACEEDLHGQRR